MKTALKAKVSGRVQGVFYRSFTVGEARKLGLIGYVRNSPDGSVEVYAEGDRDRLEELVKRLRAGPPAATVESVDTEWLEQTGQFTGFKTAY